MIKMHVSANAVLVYFASCIYINFEISLHNANTSFWNILLCFVQQDFFLFQSSKSFKYFFFSFDTVFVKDFRNILTIICGVV